MPNLTDTMTPQALAVNNLNAPKLSYFDRCVIFGLSQRGLGKRVLAAAFSVNRSTVSYIVTPSSPHYRNVRREFKEIGPEEFHAKYTDSTVAMDRWHDKLQAALNVEDVPDREQHKIIDRIEVPNKTAKSHSGVIWVSAYFGTAQFIVRWAENDLGEDELGIAREPGWYVFADTEISGFVMGSIAGLNSDRFTSKKAALGFAKQVQGELAT